jgi:hypothetical protein
MPKSFKPHKEILPPRQRELWPLLADAKELGFVLYGGTAIALHLNHRQSIDFDFFTEVEFDSETLKKTVSWVKNAQCVQNTENTCSFEYNEVKVSFFGGIKFGRAGVPLLTDDGVLEVASLKDLMGLKLATIMERVNYKDYRDLGAMIKHGLSLEEGLGTGEAFYGKSFSVSSCLRTLTYFEGNNMGELSREEKNLLLDAASKVRKIPFVPLLSKNLSERKISAKTGFHSENPAKNQKH